MKLSWKLNETLTPEKIKLLRNCENDYCKPVDCPAEKCLKYRPACTMGSLSICHIAVKKCGDF